MENAVRLLITRFMSLNPSDLENWMADPEEWVNLEDKENDQWEYEIRVCSIIFFVYTELMLNFRLVRNGC